MTKTPLSAGALASLAMIVAVPVAAQTGPEEPVFIEEIITTATKREQTLQETPVAVTVIGAEAMQRAQVRDIKDLQAMVPSLRISQLQTSGNTNGIIRGFGNGANNPLSACLSMASTDPGRPQRSPTFRTSSASKSCAAPRARSSARTPRPV